MSLEHFIYDPKFRIARHLAFWLVWYLDEVLSIIGITPEIGMKDIFLPLAFDLALVYFNLLYLIPRFFLKEKYQTYFLLTALTLVLNILISTAIGYEDIVEGELFYSLFHSFLLTTGILGIAVAIKIAKITYRKQQQLNDLQQNQLKAELNYLKKQVNPHFLFNVLNNIYVQSKEDPKSVPESILQLSELMRYQTYDAAKDRISLGKEIDFIEKYLSLEKMRCEFLKTEMKLTGAVKRISIPPLLLLPFVENACKHSHKGNGDEELIEIHVTQKEADLMLMVKNTQGLKTGHINDEEYSGFGMDNIKKRIELLYPDSHQLNFSEDDNFFTVELIIQNINSQ